LVDKGALCRIHRRNALIPRAVARSPTINIAANYARMPGVTKSRSLATAVIRPASNWPSAIDCREGWAKRRSGRMSRLHSVKRVIVQTDLQAAPDRPSPGGQLSSTGRTAITVGVNVVNGLVELQGPFHDQTIGGNNVHDTGSVAGSVVARCVASLAVQPRLGLLPKWRSRISAGDPGCLDTSSGSVTKGSA
jgi:hypothetical protein